MNLTDRFKHDEAGFHLMMAAYHEIHRGHIEAYCRMAFSKPETMTDAEREAITDALLAFSNLGWSAFHMLNRGQPLKDAPTRPAKKAKVKRARK